jgi:ABC-2 type transport system ATP-binding protein
MKRYGELIAVNGLDLRVETGECFGLLGPNGAGKTTTVEILEGLTPSDGGTVELLGTQWRRDASDRALQERLGIQLQETQFSEKMTVQETLCMFRSFFRRGHGVDEVIARVSLDEKRNDRVGRLSGGQRQRLAVACALVNEPDLLLLDEPSTGLDPQARLNLWEVVADFRAGGRTVLLTTHYMEEADSLSDRLAIIDDGRVLALGSPEKLKATLGAHTIFDLKLRSQDGLEALAAKLRERRDVTSADVTPDGLRVIAASSDGLLPDLVQAAAGHGLRDLQITEPSLETVFIQLTGRDLRE